MSFDAEVFIQKFYTEIFQCGQTINSKVAVFVKVKSLSRVRLFATRWTVAYHAPPSMGFPGKSTGVGCHVLIGIIKGGKMGYHSNACN